MVKSEDLPYFIKINNTEIKVITVHIISLTVSMLKFINP